MSERELAENTAKAWARLIVDEAGGATLGGKELGEKYFGKMIAAQGYNHRNLYRICDALTHWVDCAGYDKQGNFKIVLSSYFRY